MSTFELLVLVLLFCAVVPVWGLTILLLVTANKKHSGPSARFTAYVGIVNSVLDELGREINRAPVIIAGLRELQAYPEYRDITVLLIDELEVTGKTHFDQLLKQELTRLETSLLEAYHE